MPGQAIRRSPLAQQLPYLWWRKAATQGFQALESAVKESGLHVVCPPTFIATRQRCGGACREELGGP
ncbi:hypothetical protein EMIT0373P_20460 [Pseudomonas chlororaphis]